MYNHNKAQQSKNRVHISWDMLYKQHLYIHAACYCADSLIVSLSAHQDVMLKLSANNTFRLLNEWKLKVMTYNNPIRVWYLNQTRIRQGETYRFRCLFLCPVLLDVPQVYLQNYEHEYMTCMLFTQSVNYLLSLNLLGVQHRAIQCVVITTLHCYDYVI